MFWLLNSEQSGATMPFSTRWGGCSGGHLSQEKDTLCRTLDPKYRGGGGVFAAGWTYTPNFTVQMYRASYAMFPNVVHFKFLKNVTHFFIQCYGIPLLHENYPLLVSIVFSMCGHCFPRSHPRFGKIFCNLWRGKFTNTYTQELAQKEKGGDECSTI